MSHFIKISSNKIVESGDTDFDNINNLTMIKMMKLYYFYYDRIDIQSVVLYDILIFDNELINDLRKILKKPSLFKTLPTIPIDSLFMNINKLKLKYSKQKYHKKHIERLIDFIEELYNGKYAMMNNMISNNIINFDILWYYFKDKYYKIKLFDNYICIKFKNCTYKKDNEIFEIRGNIIYIHDDELYKHQYIHIIDKFNNVKKITTLNIKPIKNILKFINSGLKILDIYNTTKCMYLEGNQYVQDKSDVLIYIKKERVIVDMINMYKHNTMPIDISPIKSINKNDISKNDMSIVLPYVGIYNLVLNKKWGMAYIDDLHEIQYDDIILKNVHIEQNKLDIMINLIKSYTDNDFDYIFQKGNGINILLYGPSGSGKKLTVEAISEYLHMPLFRIHINDLGTDPEGVELYMAMVFKYAKIWNLIILIEDVDVYVGRKISGYTNKNALTDIFLKVLEYYSGIVFLTTDRINSLDSRIKDTASLMIKYTKPDINIKENIWVSLLTKNGIVLNSDILKKLSNYNLTGKEIRNYIKIVMIINKYNKNIDSKIFYKTFQKCFDINNQINKKNDLHMYT